MNKIKNKKDKKGFIASLKLEGEFLDELFVSKSFVAKMSQRLKEVIEIKSVEDYILFCPTFFSLKDF